MLGVVRSTEPTIGFLELFSDRVLLDRADKLDELLLIQLVWSRRCVIAIFVRLLLGDFILDFLHIHVSSDGLEKDVKFAFTKRATAILVKESKRLPELYDLIVVKAAFVRDVNRLIFPAQVALCLLPGHLFVQLTFCLINLNYKGEHCLNLKSRLRKNSSLF